MKTASTKGKTAVLLCGGFSRRMGSDKFLLELNDKPQWAFMHDMLSKMFDTIYISCRADQVHHFPNQQFILDPPESIGPMGGLVNAFHTIENANSIFFVGCDLPNFQIEIVEKLLDQNHADVDVCAAQSESKDKPEPVVAFWNRTALPALEQGVSTGDYALFKCMQGLRVKCVSFPDELLKNVNRQEDR